jgi:hypothetical protein
LVFFIKNLNILSKFGSVSLKLRQKIVPKFGTKKKKKSRLRTSINVFSNLFFWWQIFEKCRPQEFKMECSVANRLVFLRKKGCANFIEGKKNNEKILAIFQHSFGVINFHIWTTVSSNNASFFSSFFFPLLMLCQKTGKSTTLASIIEQCCYKGPNYPTIVQ